ncbi:hypothetical protein [Streptomyces sp. S186]|uniref:hypothetical protein n=1 Tax=Streptomyces sp. S186 TaxID=3434395 RepID=UPI003F673380
MTTPSNSPEVSAALPEAGDVVEYAPGRTAVVTDIVDGVPWLRDNGFREWPADESGEIRVVQRRAEPGWGRPADERYAPPAGGSAEQAGATERPTVEDLLAQAERLNEEINRHQERLGGYPE